VKPTVLVVDDEEAFGSLLAEDLGELGIAATVARSSADALDVLGREPFDVVVADVKLRGPSGIDLCERIVAGHPDVPVIVMTAFGSLETAIAAIRAGAYDFLNKPFEREELAMRIERAAQHRLLREEVKRLRTAVARSEGDRDILGQSGPIQRVLTLLDRIGTSDASVLVTGESGTGKEVVARAIHRRSRRRDGPLVAINCAAMPETLLESELFGHVKGAFTDARTARRGLFAEATGGTLFLDEVAELPLGLQPKLLRALQERSVRPVGSDREVATDVRIVAATNRDLEAAVEQGRLREDLYYRLDVIRVELPPLRARGTDVLLLAQHFLEQIAERAGKHVTGISPKAAERLLAYSWPGNVRELQNSIERAIAVARYDAITVEDLPERVQRHRSSDVLVTADDPAELVPMEEVERRYVLRVLEAVRGNKSLAARILGFDRKTLYTKLQRYGGSEPDRSHDEARSHPPVARSRLS